MAHARLLDAYGGVIRRFWVDDETGSSVIHSYQDAEPYIEANKRTISFDPRGISRDRSLRRVASIPNIVWEKWMRDDGVNLMRLPKREKAVYLRRKLNDPDWRWLRTSEGRF